MKTNLLSIPLLLLGLVAIPGYAQDSRTGSPVRVHGMPPTADVTMQNAATATGNGTVLAVTGYGTSTVQVTGTFSATITFEGTTDGSNWHALSATQIGTTTIATTATTTGVYRLSVSGLTQIRARISAYTSGSVTAIGRATNAPFGPKVINAALAAGTASIGTVQPGNTANTTPWLVSLIPPTTGGVSTCYLSSAASTNSTSCKASAGQLYNVRVINTTSTIYYLRLYNSSSAPTCSSATGFVESIPIPHGSGAGAGVANSLTIGQTFGTGLGFCLTGGGGSTDNTNAATGVYISLLYK